MIYDVTHTLRSDSSTVVIAIPTQTVTVTIGDATITVAPGGTPVGSVPLGIGFPDAITPTWNPNPIIPTSMSSATFTSGTWTTVVPLPTSTNQPVVVRGPPSNDGDDDNEWWLILGLAGVIILGILPPGVGVVGGIVPVPVPPPTWPPGSPWIIPPPIVGGPDEGDDDDDDDEEFCPLTYPEIPAEEDEDDDLYVPSNLVARASNDRRFRVPQCTNIPGTAAQFPTGFTLNQAPWYTVNANPNTVSDSITLLNRGTPASKPSNGQGVGTVEFTIHEHLFEFRYLSDFFATQFGVNDCAWLQSFWGTSNEFGVLFRHQLFRAIDQAANSAWTDDVVNKVKSSVSNNSTPNSSPLLAIMSKTTQKDWVTAAQKENWRKVEIYIRAFAMLGQYFNTNSAQFKATAERIQLILANYTPHTPINPPLDARFHAYAQATFSLYEDRVRTRGINMLREYKTRMNQIRDAKHIATGNMNLQVPPCWRVYHSQIIDGIFHPTLPVNPNPVNTALLIHTPIQHPTCNYAGTEGDVVWRLTAAGQPVYSVGTPPPKYKIMGIGNSYYGLGLVTPGNPPSYTFMRDVADPTLTNPSCSGVRGLVFQTHTAATIQNPKAQFRLDCLGANTATAPSTLTPVDRDGNGNVQTCFLYNYNDGSNGFDVLCGNVANVDACIPHLNTVRNFPNGNRSNLDMRFNP